VHALFGKVLKNSFQSILKNIFKILKIEKDCLRVTGENLFG
jgi:hypothetical protein